MLELILKIFKENPDAAVDIIHGYIEKYKPVAYRVGNECLEIVKDYVGNDELYNLKAEHEMKKFAAYKKAGFTEEQALAILLNDNLKLMKNLKEMSVSNSSKVAEKPIR